MQEFLQTRSIEISRFSEVGQKQVPVNRMEA